MMMMQTHQLAPAPLFDPTDWKYEMRRDMQEIIPGLFLGPYAAAKDYNHLKGNNITHIFMIRESSEEGIIKPLFPTEFHYEQLNLRDQKYESLIPLFPQTKAYLDRIFAEGGRVLVHCNTGISRSAAIVVAYIMETFELDFQQAYAYVQNRRFCICPNDGFLNQLKEYEPIFKARRFIERIKKN